VRTVSFKRRRRRDLRACEVRTMEGRMKTRVLVLAAAALAALTFAATAAADAKQVTVPVDDSFVVTDLCEFPVTISIQGTLLVTLVYDQEGEVVREIDRFQGGTITYSSANGSFSFPISPTIFDYGEGAEIGSEVTVKLVGLEGHAPGFISSDAGIIIFLHGVVVGFDEEFGGIPIVDFGEPDIFHGHFGSSEDIQAAICAALS
jgi:hypothetical protein